MIYIFLAFRGTRTTHADALHQAGRRAEAETRFREAEQMQQGRQPDYPLLYSLPGFRYCDLHLTEAERAAWCLGRVGVSPAVPGVPPGTSGSPAPQSSGWDCQRVRRDAEPGGPEAHPTPELAAACRAVSQRAAQSLEWAKSQDWLLDIALDHLTLGRAALYAPILETGPLDPLGGASLPLDRTRECAEHLDAAVSGLRRAGHQDYLPLGLLTRAWLRFLTGARTGRESAQEDLDEAWEIAERGPMRLFLADIHLYRARLFFREAVYPWAGDDAGNPRGPKDDLKAAEALIDRCGYHRRDGELADAWEAIGR